MFGEEVGSLALLSYDNCADDFFSIDIFNNCPGQHERSYNNEGAESQQMPIVKPNGFDSHSTVW
jgi:hypothetical protein